MLLTTNLFKMGLVEAVSKALVVAVEKEFSNPYGVREALSTEELVAEAMAQVKQLRDEVILYDTHHRAADLKPCKNHRVIADRIIKSLSTRLQLANINRVYAYKVLFIMYLICRMHPPKRKSWWENKFLEDLPDYLEKTNYFRDVDCKYRLSVLLDELTADSRLPLAIPLTKPAPKPNYPIIGPIEMQTYINCQFESLESTGCVQYYSFAN